MLLVCISRSLWSFFLFPFCFIFIYSQNYTPMVLYEEIFLCTSTLLYMTNLFCTRIGILSLYVTWSNPIYIQRSFSFFSNTHLWLIQKFLYIHSLLTHTRISLHASLTHTKPSIHIFLLHTGIYTKTLFLFFTNMTFIHNASLFLLGFLVHFTFMTTFLNEKLYTVPEFQQTLLTTMKQVST